MITLDGYNGNILPLSWEMYDCELALRPGNGDCIVTHAGLPVITAEVPEDVPSDPFCEGLSVAGEAFRRLTVGERGADITFDMARKQFQAAHVQGEGVDLPGRLRLKALRVAETYAILGSRRRFGAWALGASLDRCAARGLWEHYEPERSDLEKTAFFPSRSGRRRPSFIGW